VSINYLAEEEMQQDHRLSNAGKEERVEKRGRGTPIFQSVPFKNPA
jgi:hypothetical protein